MFTATVDHISGIRSVTWWLNRTLLDPADDQARIDGVGYRFSQSGLALTLTTDATSAYEFELRVAVQDANADRFTTSRCVTFNPVCPRTFPVVGHWRDLVGVVTGLPTTLPR